MKTHKIFKASNGMSGIYRHEDLAFGDPNGRWNWMSLGCHKLVALGGGNAIKPHQGIVQYNAGDRPKIIFDRSIEWSAIDACTIIAENVRFGEPNVIRTDMPGLAGCFSDRLIRTFFINDRGTDSVIISVEKPSKEIGGEYLWYVVNTTNGGGHKVYIGFRRV